MSANHPALFYKSEDVLHNKIVEFFNEAISEHERCVFFTTKADGDEIFKKLKETNDTSKVVKLFSYYALPDPVASPDEFEEKSSKLFKKFASESFVGRLAFNVLCDMSRFSPTALTKVEEAEKYLHSICGNKRRFLCSFQYGKENESSQKLKQIAHDNHDHAIYEQEDGTFKQVALN